MVSPVVGDRAGAKAICLGSIQSSPHSELPAFNWPRKWAAPQVNTDLQAAKSHSSPQHLTFQTPLLPMLKLKAQDFGYLM